MSYVDEVLERVKTKNASEPEFLQAVDEVLESLRPVIEANEEKYRTCKRAAILRMEAPLNPHARNSCFPASRKFSASSSLIGRMKILLCLCLFFCKKIK